MGHGKQTQSAGEYMGLTTLLKVQSSSVTHVFVSWSVAHLSACCSSIGVREQASPVKDNARPIAKTEHTRFSMVPPVARDTGTLDALSPIRDILPGNTRQENSRLGGWQKVQCFWRFSRRPARFCMDNGEDLGVNPARRGKRQERSMDI